MSESYFNEEQQAHMRYLASIPREQRCASGWHLIGQCYGEPCKPSDPRYTCSGCGCGIRVCKCPAASTSIDIEDTRRDHIRYYNELWGGHYCKADHQRWPCRMTQALDALVALRGLLKAWVDDCLNEDCGLCHDTRRALGAMSPPGGDA